MNCYWPAKGTEGFLADAKPTCCIWVAVFGRQPRKQHSTDIGESDRRSVVDDQKLRGRTVSKGDLQPRSTEVVGILKALDDPLERTGAERTRPSVRAFPARAKDGRLGSHNLAKPLDRGARPFKRRILRHPRPVIPLVS